MPIININAEINEVTQSLQASLSSNQHRINAEISSGIIYAISPTAKVEQLPNGNYLITITDKNGTTTAEIENVNEFVKVKTTEEWNSDISLISQKGVIYVYSDYITEETESGEQINNPGIKIGDGLAYIVDLPFINGYIEKELLKHINNSNIHVTLDEKNFWNNKFRCYISTKNNDQQNLIFTTD